MRIRSYNVKRAQFITSDVLELTLEAGSPKDRLWYYPGQYAAIGFKKHSRPSPMRCFSITSSPNSAELRFSMRVQGDYTNALAQLVPGDHVFVRGPYGSFVIDEALDKNVIMLAGGIGVTPFMSMIRHMTAVRSVLPMTLLYSNSSQNNVPFYEEIIELEKTNPRFKAAFFITNGEKDKLAQGRVVRGRLTQARLNSITGGQFNNYTYFICGPKQFSGTMKKHLLDSGTDPSRIITEEFTTAGKITDTASSINRWTYGLVAASIIFGTGFIMVLDLARSVPTILAYENRASIQHSATAQPTPLATPNSQSASVGSNVGSGAQASAAPTLSAPVQSQPATSSTYIPPITSVS